MAERGKDFADIAYTMMVVEKSHSIEAVAAALNMSYAALHARLINRTCFSADEIRGVIAAAPSAKLVSYLLEGTRFVAADRVEGGRDDVPAAIQRSATHVVVNAADILHSIDEALSDRRIDHREALSILEGIENARRTLASLKLKIESAGVHPAPRPDAGG
ncbi:phage regulatory CII family protein [Chenggangzhangella methanolivorans]|uniref:Uncharacterized protein n=1 Tax=Chenggangzhangella methanolivorans TaxID=1437009 RepID=A0A9E6UM50_9HYPH|nr:phage regulatory CII family protein [Chenggangzhangella methanolivorans]QZN98818.1 hypothetical protein K6K41_17990 [Chenggangzhangella methanolivorans]